MPIIIITREYQGYYKQQAGGQYKIFVNNKYSVTFGGCPMLLTSDGFVEMFEGDLAETPSVQVEITLNSRINSLHQCMSNFNEGNQK
jgi:hypothetical protein